MLTSTHKLGMRLSLLVSLAVTTSACDTTGPEIGDERGGDESDGRGQQTFEPTSGRTIDAGQVATDAGSSRTTTDARATAGDAAAAVIDAGGCSAGQVRCGASCIDVIAPTAAAVQERVFQRSCALARSCHTGDTPQAGLTLSSVDEILASAVGKPASQVPTLSLLEPGRPEDSYIVRKLRNLQTVGTAMPPPPAAALCEPKIQAVEAWVRAGAVR